MILLVGILCLCPEFVSQAQTNGFNVLTNLQLSLSDTYASGWVTPTSWKLVYDKQVVQNEVILQLNTPQSKFMDGVRIGAWIQNPLRENDSFAPPAGEVDYFFGILGPTLKGLKSFVEVRFIDVGGPKGAEVGTFGDNDLLRFRLRLDYPIKFDHGRQTITPTFGYFRMIPIHYQPKTAGNSMYGQLSYEFKPCAWFRIGINGGIMHDDGIRGGIPADIGSYGVLGGLRPFKGYPECWLNAGYQRYHTFDDPINRPHKDFDLLAFNVTTKF